MIITKHLHSACSVLGKRWKVETGNGLAGVLSQQPVKHKADLVAYCQEHYEELVAKGILFSETSGTTGAPLMTPRSPIDLNWNANNQLNAYKRHVQAQVDRVAIIHPGVLSPFVEASSIALKNLGVGYVRIYPVPKVCDYQRMVAVIEKYQITTIMTTPTLAYKFLFEASELGLVGEDFPIRKVLLTGESISQENCRNMEQILGEGARVSPFVYGSSESATIMFGNDDGSYTDIAEDFVYELVDPQSNLPVEDNGNGEITGKLVVTWLRDGLLPIDRYDTNDLFRLDINPDGTRKWHYIGRHTVSAQQVMFQAEFDRRIYRSGAPVFHYECSVSATSVKVEVAVGKENELGRVADLVREAVSGVIPPGKELDIVVNPNTFEFFDFSVKPKMDNFKYI